MTRLIWSCLCAGVLLASSVAYAESSASLRLMPGRFVSGKVLNIESGAPQPGVDIYVEDVATSSGADGCFHAGPLLHGKRPSHVALASHASPLWRIVQEPETRENGSACTQMPDDLLVHVAPRRYIEVSVVGETGQSNRTVHLVSDTGCARPIALAKVTARLEIPGPGRHWIYASSDGGRRASRFLELFAPPGESVVKLLSGRSSGEAGDTDTSASVSPAATYPPLHAKAKALTAPLELLLGDCTALECSTIRADSQGATQPLARCRIQMAIPNALTADGNPVPLAEKVSDANGHASFACMPSGAFACVADNQASTQRFVQPQLLLPGQTGFVEFRFSAGARFAGKVFCAEASPVAGATVKCFVEGSSTGSIRPVEEMRTSTDYRGAFEIDDIDATTLSLVRVEHPAFAVSDVRELALPAEDVVIAMKARPGIRFRVDAPPSSKWEISLLGLFAWNKLPYDGQLMGHLLEEALVNGGVEAVISPPADGRYALLATAIDSGNPDAQDVAVSEITGWVEAQAQAPRVTVLHPNAHGTLIGELKGFKPARKVNIEAINTLAPENSALNLNKEVTAVSSRFSFEALAPGNYLLMASGAGYAAAATNVEVAAGRVTHVSLNPLQLRDVRGKVILNEKPVPAGRVQMSSLTCPDAHEKQAITDADGRFVFSGIMPDSYVVRAEYPVVAPKNSPAKADRIARAQRSVSVRTDSDPEELIVDLTPPRPVSFAVPGSSGQTDQVYLLRPDTREMIDTRWNGKAYEAQVPAGRYEVHGGERVIGELTVTREGTFLRAF